MFQDLAGRNCCPLLDGMSQKPMVSYLPLPGCFHPLQDAEGPEGGDGKMKMEEGEGKEKRREKEDCVIITIRRGRTP